MPELDAAVLNLYHLPAPAITLPLTSSFSPGAVIPIPTLPSGAMRRPAGTELQGQMTNPHALGLSIEEPAQRNMLSPACTRGLYTPAALLASSAMLVTVEPRDELIERPSPAPLERCAPAIVSLSAGLDVPMPTLPDTPE